MIFVPIHSGLDYYPGKITGTKMSAAVCVLMAAARSVIRLYSSSGMLTIGICKCFCFRNVSSGFYKSDQWVNRYDLAKQKVSALSEKP